MLGDLHMHEVPAIDVIRTRDYVDWTMQYQCERTRCAPGCGQPTLTTPLCPSARPLSVFSEDAALGKFLSTTRMTALYCLTYTYLATTRHELLSYESVLPSLGCMTALPSM
jgi:hypothetical protein